MNTEDNVKGDDIVTNAYRDFSTESAPEDLNRVILSRSRAAVRKSILSRLYGWRRPLAFAATLVLGVSLVYDMQSLLRESGDQFLPVTSEDETSGVRLADPAEPAAVHEAEDLDAAPMRQDTASQDRSAAPGKIATPPPADQNAVLQSQETPSSELRSMPARERTEATALPAVPIEAVSGQAKATPSSLAAEARLRDQPACSEEQKATPDSWSRCIQDMRSTGANEAADTEQQKLRRRFPDYIAPE